MIERLRFLLDRPLDPLAARAVVVFATAILLGLAAIFVLGASRPGPAAVLHEQGLSAQARPGRPSGRAPLGASASPRSRPRQDPQDEKGSLAAKRAARVLRSHRALQHVPFRQGDLSIELVGAQGGRAALRVSAPTLSAARRGWRLFLHHYRDMGRAYVPRFDAGSSNGRPRSGG